MAWGGGDAATLKTPPESRAKERARQKHQHQTLGFSRRPSPAQHAVIQPNFAGGSTQGQTKSLQSRSRQETRVSSTRYPAERLMAPAHSCGRRQASTAALTPHMQARRYPAEPAHKALRNGLDLL